MLEYWMANNVSWSNSSPYLNDDYLEDPGSAPLFPDYPPWLLYFAASCCLIFMVIGIPGNLITVVALFRTKKLRNATAVFIMNLSISDLMFCCFNLPLAMSTFWHSAWLHGRLLCRLFPLLRYSLLAVSIFTVLAITINRYIMIGHPRLYPRLYKPKYLALMVVSIWISGFGALVTTWFGQWGQFGLDPAIGSCSILPDIHGRSPKEFLFILAFVIPCLAIVVCYARIFYIVRKTAMRSRRNKVSRDLTKSNLEVRYAKNQHLEDSAIGSSCVATLTTIENGNSPTRQQEKLSYIGSNSPKLSSSFQNFRQSPKFDDPDERSSKLVNRYRRSSVNLGVINGEIGTKFNDTRGRNSSINLTIGYEASGKKSSNESKSEDKERSASLSSVTEKNTRDKSFLPTIEYLRGSDSTSSQEARRTTVGLNVDGLEEQNREKVCHFSGEEARRRDSSSTEMRDDEIPFIDASLTGRNTGVIGSLTTNKDKSNQRSNLNFKMNETCPQIRFEEVYVQVAKEGSIVANVDDEPCGIEPTKRPIRFEENSLQVPRRYQSTQHSSESLVNSQNLRYDEISEDYVSSRSESPSDRRPGKKTQVFRRESRFRSMRNRQYETGKLNNKDKKLLKMILVIFLSFLICYLPITITKIFREIIDWRGLNIAGYILIYLTTCINPVIYVVMSSEYRSAYKNVLLCRSDSISGRGNGPN